MAAITRAMRRAADAYEQGSGVATAAILAVVGALTIVLGLVDLTPPETWGGPARDIPALWHLVPLAVGCVGVLWRRTKPARALAVTLLAFLADAAIGGSLALVLVLFDGVYAAERFGSGHLRRAVRFGAGVITLGVAVAGIVSGLPLRATAAATLQTGGLLAIPIWWAYEVRQRAELAEAAESRAELEAARHRDQARAQQAERRSAVQSERTRMAQELHDAVAGDVSALVIRAGAALATPPGPADREALGAIRESGLHALGELRSMIEVLSADVAAEPVAPVLTVDGDDLLLRADTDVTGSPSALSPLPASVDRAGYRILQEALTNATKHGQGPSVVTLARAEGEVVIEVANAVGGGAAADPDGLGLTSMTARATAVGGALEVETEPGGWRLVTRLPTTEKEIR